jgi:uncharacterized protein (DUF427 family)
MTDKPIKIPGPDHPISIDVNPSRVLVKVGGKVIADTSDALTLREASYPPVQYIPRRDVDMAALTRSEHTTYCPYKGDASYYSIPAGGDRSRNAVWTYEPHLRRWPRSRITSPSTRIVSTRSANRRRWAGPGDSGRKAQQLRLDRSGPGESVCGRGLDLMPRAT